MKRQPMTPLFDDTEYLPLFAGLPVPVDAPPAPERTDSSGPVNSWEWAGTLEDFQANPPAELVLWGSPAKLATERRVPKYIQQDVPLCKAYEITVRQAYMMTQEETR